MEPCNAPMPPVVAINDDYIEIQCQECQARRAPVAYFRYCGSAPYAYMNHQLNPINGRECSLQHNIRQDFIRMHEGHVQVVFAKCHPYNPHVPPNLKGVYILPPRWGLGIESWGKVIITLLEQPFDEFQILRVIPTYFIEEPALYVAIHKATDPDLPSKGHVMWMSDNFAEWSKNRPEHIEPQQWHNDWSALSDKYRSPIRMFWPVGDEENVPQGTDWDIMCKM